MEKHMTKTFRKKKRSSENIFQVLRSGIHAGIPIGLGYFAVSFSLGIAARNAGLTAFQSFLASMLCNASAGEYAGFTSIAANATYLEIGIITLVANLRYLLMSCAMSQRLRPGFPLIHRLLMGYYLTDELFGIAISRPGYLDPFYTYGAVLIAGPAWGIGTALGNIAGSLLPARLVSALSVALYGMFLAVIIPPSRKNKVIAGIVSLSFVSSLATSYLPKISQLSQGTRTILLTICLSATAALLFPVKQNTNEEELS